MASRVTAGLPSGAELRVDAATSISIESHKTMGIEPKKWKLVTSFPITEYQCGAKRGEQVRLKKDIVIQSHDGIPTGNVHSAGEIWTVFPGSSEPPIVLWLCQPDGHRHTWDDDAGFWEWFERI